MEDKINIIEMLLLQIQIIKIQIAILLLRKKLTVPNLPKPTKIILHHEAADYGFLAVNDWHRKKWGFKSSLNFFCGYTYYIAKSGKIHQARRDTEEGAHTKGFNKSTIGICLQGNGCEQTFTREQLWALRDLIDKKRQEYNIGIENVYGHEDFAMTMCPSPQVMKWLYAYKHLDKS